MTDDKPAIELAFDELAAVVAEKTKAGISFTEYLKKLEAEVETAERRLELARAAADACEATKTRKPRSDKGQPRKRRAAVASKSSDPASASPAETTA